MIRKYYNLVILTISLEAEPKKIIIHVNGSDVTLIQKRRATNPEIKSFDVGSSDTSLRQCVESNVGRFQRGCAFYEFTHEMECISEDKELIFMLNVCEA